VIKIILAVQGVVLAGLLLLAADLYAHKRVERVGGFNIWGYRGAVVKQRAPGDARILLLGGTRAYGYGAGADDTIAHALEWELTVQTRRPTTVIDAANMGATASDYATMVDRHADLDPDVIVLYDDLGYAATRPRRSSIAGAFNGYEPILPLVLEEKGMFLRQRASVVSRSLGWLFETIGRGLKNVESSEAPLNSGEYATLMIAAAERALPHATVLIVVDPPQHPVQHQHLQELRDRLAARGDPRLKLRQLPEVADPSELLDGYSYGGAARGRVMRAILPSCWRCRRIRRAATSNRSALPAIDRTPRSPGTISMALRRHGWRMCTSSRQRARRRPASAPIAIAWRRSSRIGRTRSTSAGRSPSRSMTRGTSPPSAASGRGSGPSPMACWRSAEPIRRSGARSMAAG
jgi:hypothetical protein